MIRVIQDKSMAFISVRNIKPGQIFKTSNGSIGFMADEGWFYLFDKNGIPPKANSFNLTHEPWAGISEIGPLLVVT